MEITTHFDGLQTPCCQSLEYQCIQNIIFILPSICANYILYIHTHQTYFTSISNDPYVPYVLYVCIVFFCFHLFMCSHCIEYLRYILYIYPMTHTHTPHPQLRQMTPLLGLTPSSWKSAACFSKASL